MAPTHWLPPSVSTLILSRSSPELIEEAPDNIQTIVEAWAQGFNVGAFIVLILFTLCNYRGRVLLHKLILLELVFAIWHGLFVFFKEPVYGWVLSGTAIPLYLSYNIHNVISWIKIRPFLPRWGGRLFIISLALVQPYWILETYANFQYFNNLGGDIFKESRFYEPLTRDPWWIFTTVKLVLVIQQNYEYTMLGLIRHSPRFGIMLLCMFLSIIFLVTDVAVTARISTQSGINPFWRLALVFKCASDTIFLDDFKSVLDRIAESAIKRIANLPYGSSNRKKSFGAADHRELGRVRTEITAASIENTSQKHSRIPWVGAPRSASVDCGAGSRGIHQTREFTWKAGPRPSSPSIGPCSTSQEDILTPSERGTIPLARITR
jgi:hypothetical protein